LQTVDFNLNTLPNARLVLIEQDSGVFYSVTTNNAGTASLQMTFGKYKVNVYTSDNILLNATAINVLSNTQSQIQCALYNLHVTVKVVDYFGNPVSNANIELGRAGVETRTATTQGDGTATFENIIGGNVEIIAYTPGTQGSFVATNLQLDSPTNVQVQMSKYVVLGGLLIETSLLATILIILIAMVLFAVMEVLRRRGVKLRRKTESKDIQ